MSTNHMNGRTFVDKTLVGNWFESRFDVDRAACTEQRLLRTGKVGKAPITGSGNAAADPDMYVSVNNGTYTERAKLRPDTDVTMLTKETAKKFVENKSAPVNPGYPTEFPVLEDSFTAREFVTTTHAAHGGKYDSNPDFQGSGLIKSVADTKSAYPVPGFENAQSTYKSVHVGAKYDENYGSLNGEGVPAGKVDDLDAGRGVMSFGSTGERPKLAPEDDPKEHTLMQRSWVYSRGINNYNGQRPKKESVYSNPPPGIPGIGLKRPEKKQVFTRKNDTIPDGVRIWNDV